MNSDDKQHGVGLNAAVAAELRAEMNALGMTQGRLADASGISKVSVQRYLKPTRAIDMEVLEALASGLRIAPAVIMRRAIERQERITAHPDAEMLAQLTPEQQAEILGAEDAPRNQDTPSTRRSTTG